jgi:IS5 family transposase
LSQKITGHVRATKRALFSWSQTAKANPKEREAKGRKILKRVARLVIHTVQESRNVLQSLRGSASNQSAKLKQRLCDQIELAQTIVNQTEQQLQGILSIPERIVSFHDAQARPIRKGKLNKAVEFGRTLQLVQDCSGVIVHYEAH